MIHCMVNRRFAPARRRTSLVYKNEDLQPKAGFLENDSSKEASSISQLARLPLLICHDSSPSCEFSLGDKLCSGLSDSDSNKVEKNEESVLLRGISDLSLRDTKDGASEDRDESVPDGKAGCQGGIGAGSSRFVGPMQRLCLWRVHRPCPYDKPSNGRRERMLKDVALRPTRLYDSLEANQLGEFAWLALNDCLVHYDTPYSLAKLSTHLDENDATIWEGLAPLQRVIVVAVAAAVTAAVKDRNLGEISNLQQALESREQSSNLLRQELRQLWDQMLSTKSAASEQVMEMCSMPGDNAVDKIEVVDGCLPQLEVSNASSGNLEPRGSRGWDNPLFGDSMLDTEDPMNWLSVESSVTSLDSFYGSPQRLSRRVSRKFNEEVADDGSRMRKEGFAEETGLVTGATASRAEFASTTMGIREQATAFLEREVSGVMSALTSVIDKAKEMEIHGATSQGATEVPSVSGNVLDALKSSVEHATGSVISLEEAVMDMWQTLGSKAMADPNTSPSAFENYLLSHKERSHDGQTRESNATSWRQWMTRHGALGTTVLVSSQTANNADHSCNKTELVSDLDTRCLSSVSDLSAYSAATGTVMSPWSTRGTSVSSAIQAAVDKAVETIITPHDSGKRSSGVSPSSADSVAEQLSAELEIAASKVAGMEAQMKVMKQHLMANENRRKEAELKLEQALETDQKNQCKANLYLEELTRELKLKEDAYQELMARQMSEQLSLSEKSMELRNLREIHERQSAALKQITASSEASKDASERKLAALEDICRTKDTSITGLKRQIVALEKKVSELMSLKVPSPQRGKRLSSISAHTARSSHCSSLESSFEALGVQEKSTNGTPKRRESQPKNNRIELERDNGDSTSPSILTESRRLTNVSQEFGGDFTGRIMKPAETLCDLFQNLEGRGKTGTVMHTLNHGESRISGPPLFIDENYMSMLTGGMQRPHVKQAGVGDSNSPPTTPAQKRGATFDKDSDQRLSLSRSIKENADKRRRWL